MRVLYAFAEPLPLPRARGVQVAHAISSLVNSGVAVDLAYAPVNGKSPCEDVSGEPQEGLTLIPISRGWPAPLNRIPPISRWHSVRLFEHRLRREIKERRPDVIYMRHLKLAHLVLKSRCSTPVIYEAHEVFADTAKTKYRKNIGALEGIVVRTAAGVVCNSHATANRLSELYGEPARLLVLPNGVARPADLPQKRWDQCARHVVYAGSFFGWKGVDDLVAAAAFLPGFHITLIGGEPGQIQRITRNLPSEGAELELLPRIPNSEVLERLAASCIAVLPNRPDPDSRFTSPIKLFEYMSAGCAIVCSDLPPMREVLADNEAVWFSAGNPVSLAETLRSIGSSPVLAKALGERARKSSSKYTWQKRANNLKAFLQEVIGGCTYG